MRRFIKPNRKQLLMFHEIDLNSIAPAGSTVHTIDTIVDDLDTSKYEEAYDLESAQGANPIHPKTIIKVCLYAIHTNRFSTRKMEYDAGHHLGYMYLTGARSIDHSTIGNFLVRFRQEIVELFTQTVLVCTEQELVDFKVLGTDSVKVRANASHKRQKNKKGLEKAGRKIRERIQELLEKVAGEEAAGEKARELKQLEGTLARIEEAKGILGERLKELSKGKSIKEVEALERKTTVNITDPDVHIMQQANGEKNPSYSVTTTGDSRNDIITHFQINETDNDAKALIPAMEGSEKNTGGHHEVNVADAGFSSIENLEGLEEKGIYALIPDKRLEVEKLKKTAKGSYDRSEFAFDEQADRYRCPEGNILACCGKVLSNSRPAKRYANPVACRQCLKRERCTKGKHRVIIRDEQEWVKEHMREKLQQEVNRKIYKLRSHTVEAPYGCMKRNWKFTTIMRRGAAKAAMEMALVFSLHNILTLGAVLNTG